MKEIVVSIERVNDIMGEIASASSEQLTLSVSEFSLAEQHELEFVEISDSPRTHSQMAKFEPNHKIPKSPSRLTRKRPSPDDEWKNC